jgi:hypothetical protein
VTESTNGCELRDCQLNREALPQARDLLTPKDVDTR